MAQNLLQFRKDSESEWLESRLKVDIGVIRDGEEDEYCSWNTAQSRDAPDPEEINFFAGDEYFLGISNQGDLPYRVSVFRVDCAGETQFVSAAWEKGIPLTKQEGSTLLVHDDGLMKEGIPMRWPRTIQGVESVVETFVFLITKEDADLGFLKTPGAQDSGTTFDEARKGLSSRAGNPCAATRNVQNKYDVVHLRYRLHKGTEKKHGKGRDEDGAQDVRELGKIPSLEETAEWHDFKQDQISAAKGLVGGAVRTLTRVPPYVTVVNEHDEAITVVVSRYREHRYWKGAGISASLTGMGFNIETAASYHSSLS